ncbi:hypothetical protein DFH07DRAFT_774701 [Mycena maculata]|uniref:Uncharacterized protein n=1 Tax=Mycena maculata TaxID=230809 RepID=A0AAD7IW40_9AGAR|nr:hypothetical protein DFH07DRAFT_774701 [Mycena maculata]
MPLIPCATILSSRARSSDPARRQLNMGIELAILKAPARWICARPDFFRRLMFKGIHVIDLHDLEVGRWGWGKLNISLIRSKDGITHLWRERRCRSDFGRASKAFRKRTISRPAKSKQIDRVKSARINGPEAKKKPDAPRTPSSHLRMASWAFTGPRISNRDISGAYGPWVTGPRPDNRENIRVSNRFNAVSISFDWMFR